MLTTARRTAKILTATASVAVSLVFAGTAIASASPGRADAHAQPHAAAPHYQVRQILSGMKLRHTYVPASTAVLAGSAKRKSEPLTDPDDITVLGHHIYTAFQNGVGPQGQASTDGNTDSTVVEFTGSGRVIRQWDIKGKCDGITADPERRLLIATVNEDASSSIYTIKPGASSAAQIQHYKYNKPLPHKGGTDAISIYHGRVLISASAPGTTGTAAPQPTYPAVYSVTFNRGTHVATVSALFYDEAPAIVANAGGGGKVVKLALTDPDSNEVVPGWAPRFAGDFMLTSQGDKEQIFLEHGARRSTPGTDLAVLRLSQSVDDTAWAHGPAGRLYGSDSSSDTIDVVTGRFTRSVLVAVTPCDAANAPATCPGPGFPANYLGALNPQTGHITRVPLSGPSYQPKGLVFVSPGWGVTPG